MSEFTNAQVRLVSQFLQAYMKEHHIDSLTADECAELLARYGILPNNVGPKPGFNFRQMLRDGRDGKIRLVTGASQLQAHARWRIESVRR